jgi:branched-chain amino acid transport system ATP-binding protein
MKGVKSLENLTDNSRPPILECEGISMRFEALAAVNVVSFGLGEGEILGMIGPNGAGKTTLFNCIIGVYKPTEGRVVFEGTDITGLKPHRICRLGMAKTSQIMEPFRAMTVFENVLVGAIHGGQMSMTEARLEAERVLDWVGLAPQGGKPSHSISVPARRRLELARALATGAKVLLLDENMAGLNPHEIDEALELLRAIRNSGRSLIVVEHIMRAVMGISDRIVVLNYGSKIAEGRPEQVVADDQVIQAYLGSTKVHFGPHPADAGPN